MQLTADTTLPEVLTARPSARRVLDRYGLAGCGGVLGPPESLAFFARAHGVALDRLLEELEQAGADPATHAGAPGPLPVTSDASWHRIYRAFFLAGIAVTLTAGAGWGAWLLWHLGAAGDFTSVPLHQVNAHGHAQIFGWIGLFVLGFAYQAFPRFWHTDLARPWLAWATLPMLLAGIALRVAGESLWQAPWALAAGVIGSSLEIAAAAGFVWVLVATLRNSNAGRPLYTRYVLVAGAAFVAQTVWSLGLFLATMTAPSAEALIRRVALLQPGLRDLQIHGFGLFMVTGVALRFLPGIFGFREVADRTAARLWWVMLAAVAAQVVAFPLLVATHAHAWGVLLTLADLALLATCAILAAGWALHRRPAEADRSIKFVRAAWAWLLASLAMRAAMPLFLAATGQHFSHAYFGATRHAVTVGFLSLMILGVSSRVAPTLLGHDPARMTRLWAPFLLLNLGCFLRVCFQTLTDFPAVAPTAFRVAGASGLLEVTALALWGAHIAGLVLRGDAKPEPVPAEPEKGSGVFCRNGPEGAVHKRLLTPFPAPGAIRAEHRVGDILEAVPGALDLFLARGFTPLKSPTLRRTLARRVTLAAACRLEKVDLEAFLGELNRLS